MFYCQLGLEFCHPRAKVANHLGYSGDNNIHHTFAYTRCGTTLQEYYCLHITDCRQQQRLWAQCQQAEQALPTDQAVHHMSQ